MPSTVKGKSVNDLISAMLDQRLELLAACKALLSAGELNGADSQEYFEARNKALEAIAHAEGRK